VEIVSWVSAVGDIVCPEAAANIDTLTRDQARPASPSPPMCMPSLSGGEWCW
jgi:hypothetical protein